jgi:hypothetical protein
MNDPMEIYENVNDSVKNDKHVSSFNFTKLYSNMMNSIDIDLYPNLLRKFKNS